MILMIDNYDSFTYNLVQYLECLNEDVQVYRNNQISLADIDKMDPDIIVLSPGPGTPEQSGICLDIVRSFHDRIPILGICLGHQTIGQVFGAKVVRALEPTHGKVHPVWHTGTGVFNNIPTPFQATRYHSLVLDKETLPECFEITAETEEGEIMGIRHTEFPLEGVQYHPEAILTEEGMQVLKNFLHHSRVQPRRTCHAD